MFCPKCGTPCQDNVRFCSKCGTKFEGLLECTVEKKDKEKKILRLTVLPGSAIFALLLILVCTGIYVIMKNSDAESDRKKEMVAGTASVGNQTNEDAEEVYQRNIESIVITDKETVHLDGAYSQLKSIKSNGSVYLTGEFPALQTITITVTEDKPVLVCDASMTFPMLESLECGCIQVDGKSVEKSLDKGMFPVLKQVLIKVDNKDIDNRMLFVLQSFEKMSQTGSLSIYSPDISHTIEDLYGSWSDKDDTFSLSFLENGDVRISDKTGLVGVELMTYRMAWSGTLEFKAKTDSLWALLTFEVKYRLLGNTLSVEILGKNFELCRK